MTRRDTIAACATGPPAGGDGRSDAGLALLRLSGPAAFDAVAHLLGRPVRERCAAVALLALPAADGSGLVHLPVRLLVMPGPRSYTGEDVAEIVLPANAALIDRVLAAITARSRADAVVRAAGPGEFTARAYMSGRLTLEQAEGVAATIAATTSDELAGASRLLAGRTGATYRGWADELTTLLALVEAGIDFTDQEGVVAIPPVALRDRLTTLRDAMRRELGGPAGRSGDAGLGAGVPRVVLVGAPNAGKSTLFNALLGRRRVVASPVAGTTRDAITEDLDLSPSVPGAGRVRLVDAAGLGHAADHIDAAAQASARDAARDADLLLWCDPTGRFEPFDQPIDAPHAKVVRVRTFADRPMPPLSLLPPPAPTPAPDAHRGEHVAVCAIDGWHLRELARLIADATVRGPNAGVASLLPRHRDAVRRALLATTDALGSIGADPDRLDAPELLADALRDACDAMAELSGRICVEDVLARVFATFCVGK